MLLRRPLKNDTIDNNIGGSHGTVEDKEDIPGRAADRLHGCIIRMRRTALRTAG